MDGNKPFINLSSPICTYSCITIFSSIKIRTKKKEMVRLLNDLRHILSAMRFLRSMRLNQFSLSFVISTIY